MESKTVYINLTEDEIKQVEDYLNKKYNMEKEIEFCESIDCEKNEHKQFIYTSSNNASSINLPHVLAEYKQYLIDNGIVKLL